MPGSTEVFFLGCSHSVTPDLAPQSSKAIEVKTHDILRGTCAKCDLEVEHKLLARNYYARREELMACWREAKRSGTKQAALQIEAQLQKYVADMKLPTLRLA
jgi:hypothetical protein